jgi:hypothetical protein
MADAVALNTTPASDHLIIAISLWVACNVIFTARRQPQVMHRIASELVKSHMRCIHGIAPSPGSRAFRSLCAPAVLLKSPAERPRHREEV